LVKLKDTYTDVTSQFKNQCNTEAWKDSNLLVDSNFNVFNILNLHPSEYAGIEISKQKPRKITERNSTFEQNNVYFVSFNPVGKCVM
jgi:hypothetical protein